MNDCDEKSDDMLEGFANPTASCRPHTRWWWMGNAISKEEITWQLEQMNSQGIGGVEQITMQAVYESGNVPYLSEEYFDLVTHAIAGAKKRGMEFSLNFGGPGWVIGGEWVPSGERSRNMVPTAVRVGGGGKFSGRVPEEVGDVPRTGEVRARDVGPDDRLLAVVAGRLRNGRIEESSLIDLTDRVVGRYLEWEVPDGEWQLMAFWLVFTAQGNAVDHFSKDAMSRYCEYLGSRFKGAFGEELGGTVESLFCDSFEVAMVDNGIYWSDGLLEKFAEYKGYDLVSYLPAIWWEVGEISPKVRYDVNEFLHHVGLDAFFETFLDWCEENGVNGRIQPYGFTTDIIQGAGMTHLPEMEITAGEKDAVPWFDTRIGPKKYVSSGAHLYGRDIVTVEAYTYIHWESYRATLEELKIASDVFLRSGANKFYNHGYTCSPERDIAPSRRFESEVLISHSNVWWKYYRHLSDYLARCCHVLRQGIFVADIAVYSPLASQWTLDVRNARRWTRDFEWGSLGQLLLSNGYDFDLVNDDVLQNVASLEGGRIRVGELQYSLLILPNVESMPLESLEKIRDYVSGGGVVVALERVPENSVGLEDYRRKDAEVRAIAREMFDTPSWRVNETAPREYGDGVTYHIKNVIDRTNLLERHSSSLDPFLNVLRKHVTPDVGIDFVGAGIRENRGLAFVHRRLPGREIYFLTNLQDSPIDLPIYFRIRDMVPSDWDPMTGEVRRIWEYDEVGNVTRIPIRLSPFASRIIVFDADLDGRLFIRESTFDSVDSVGDGKFQATASKNGRHRVVFGDGAVIQTTVRGVPQPYSVDGEWELVLEGTGFPGFETTMLGLSSWTDSDRTRHFSGTGRYRLEFEIPADYTGDTLRLKLDLGTVGNIAEVVLNGKSAGVRWMRGQLLDISGLAREGNNSLVVDVTNTLINRVSGLEELPPVPEYLVERLGTDARAGSSPSKRLLGYEPLPVSGLIGPVEIRAYKMVTLSTDKG